MLEWIQSMTTEQFRRLTYYGVSRYILLHGIIMYSVQWGVFDYYMVNVLQTIYMLYFIFIFVAAHMSGQVEIHKGHLPFLGDKLEHFLNAADICVLIMAVLGVVSTIFAYDREIALYGADTRNEGLFAWFAYYVLFYSVSLLDETYKRKCAKMISIIGMLMLWTGIVMSYTGIGVTLLGGSERVMAFAPLLHHNMYAAFAVLYFGIHMAMLLGADSTGRIIYAAFGVLTAIAAVICSTSSLGLGGIVFELLVLLVVSLLFDRGHGRQYIRRLLLCLIGSVLLFAILIPVIDHTNHGIISADAQSNQTMIEEEGVANGLLNGRIDHWKAGLKSLEKYWLMGVGIDNYKKVLKEYNGFGRYRVSTAHNEYIQMAVTEGVFTLMFYLMLLLIMFISGIRVWRYDDASDWLVRGAFLAFMGYICQAFVSFSSVAVTPFFWIIMAMIPVNIPILNTKDPK